MRKKVAKFDFTENSLPSNRKELFLDIFKNQYRTLMKIGGVLLLFSMPLIIIAMFADISKIQMLNTLEGSEEEIRSTILFFNTMIYGLSIIGLAILSIGVAGIVKIVKRLCYLEPVFFKEDFKLGVKDSIKTMLPIFVITGILFTFSYYIFAFFGGNLVSYLPICVSFAVFYPTFSLMMISTTIYNEKFTKLFMNSFLLFAKTLFKTLGIYIITLLPLLFILIPNVLIKMFCLALFIVFMAPIIYALVFCYDLSIFDKYINIIHYPEIYRKGLAPEKNQTNKIK